MIFDFWSPWGLYGHPKFHVLPKNAANQGCLDGYNFFVFQDNWKILSAGERYWLGQKNIFVILGCPKYFFFQKIKIKVKSAKIAY